MTNSVHPVLDTYAKGKINSLNIDTDIDKISVGISNKDALAPIEIIFEDVKAFYYIDHDLKDDIAFTNENLNIISYDDLGFGEFATVKRAEDEDVFVSIPNFAVNLNESSLYIDANKIRINNKSYHVR